MTSPFAALAAPACWPRWRPRASTCSCSGVKGTRATCRVRRGCGRPGRARSGPGASSSGATGSVYLLSTWDEGIPDDIPHENLYGISFNAGNFVKALRRIEGAATAQTVATDSLTGSSANLLPKAFPAAELVDGEPMLRRVRRVKAPEEVEAIRSSVHIAERALREAEAALTPGITERQLTGRVHAGHGLGGRHDPFDAGCRVDDLAPTPLATRQPGRAAWRRGDLWPSTPGSSLAAMPESSAGPTWLEVMPASTLSFRAVE